VHVQTLHSVLFFRAEVKVKVKVVKVRAAAVESAAEGQHPKAHPATKRHGVLCKEL
jgi:hypothetical protein